ncbi:helix-turn-helix transcriptional regulator [soil metagenome]
MSTTRDLIGGLPRNYLRACVLLLLAEAPSHGYELLEGLRDLGIDRADPGGLYRSLRAMEQEGLVSSLWEESTAGPARRSYTLTDAGEQSLGNWATILKDVRKVLDAYLVRQSMVAPGGPQQAARHL